ncbi:MAG TPA: VOC family protein [Ktedonobacterales bacterium]|nr:VOC family protein [Ktedonobacterales bacterium]
MALDLYMLGLLVKDMGQALEFYRRLGLAVPQEWDGRTHVEVKMGNGLTFFLDSKPTRWDPQFQGFGEQQSATATTVPGGYRSVLEFYLKTREAVSAKYAELIACGYQSRRAPYASPIGMYFAMVADPDDNTILLSGDLEAHDASQLS